MSLGAHILAVDDAAPNLLLIERILQSAGYTHIDTLSRSAEVVGYFEAQPPDLLLLDLQMPDPDGFEVMRLVERWTTGETYVPVLVLTADASQDTRHRALQAGARDFLTKPLDHAEVLLRIANLLQTRDLQLELQAHNELLDAKVRHRTHELDQARLEAFRKLALAAEYRDDETREHTQRVGHVAHLLAVELGMDPADAEILAQVAPLHDVGKIGIPDAILLKPGRLDEAEFAAMKGHALIGAEILGGTNSPLFTVAAEIALCHHERWDGTGYPSGLGRDGIPLPARIVALVDAFDAISHERPYKPPWPIDKALEEIQRSSGSHFDPEIVEAFMRLDHPNLLQLPPPATRQALTAAAWDTLHQTDAFNLTPNLLAAVFEHLPQALLLANDERHYVAGNAAARELLGVTHQELAQKRIDDFLPPDLRDQVDDIWAEFHRAGTQTADITLHKEDGRRVDVKFTAKSNLLPGHHLSVLEPLNTTDAMASLAAAERGAV